MGQLILLLLQQLLISTSLSNFNSTTNFLPFDIYTFHCISIYYFLFTLTIYIFSSVYRSTTIFRYIYSPLYIDLLDYSIYIFSSVYRFTNELTIYIFSSVYRSTAFDSVDNKQQQTYKQQQTFNRFDNRYSLYHDIYIYHGAAPSSNPYTHI